MSYNNNMSPYIHTGYNQGPNQAQLEYMRRQAQDGNTILRYFTTGKQLAKLHEDALRENELQRMFCELAARPIFSLTCGPSVPQCEIDMNLLPPDLLELAQYVAALTGWPLLAVLMVFIGLINTAMRGRFIIRLDEFWVEAIVLYLMVLAPSGTMKSLVHRIAIEPLVGFESRLLANYHKDSHRPRAVAQGLKRGKRAVQGRIIKKNLKLADDSASGLDMRQFFSLFNQDVLELADVANEFEVELKDEPRLMADSFTDKKLIRSMPGRGGGHAIIQPEGDRFISMLNEKKFDINIMLKGYTMESFTHGTVSGGETFIRHPFLNIQVLVQPKIGAVFFSNERLSSSGLTSRFLPVFVANARSGLFEQHDVPEHLLQTYSDKIQAMLDRNYTQDKERAIFEIKASRDAYQEVKQFQRTISSLEGKAPFIHMPSFMRKLHGAAARIASVLHAWRYENPASHPIDLRDMLAGINLATAISSHAEFAFKPSGLCAFHHAEQILKWVCRHGRARFNSRDIAQNSGVQKRDKVYSALDLLERHNYLVQLITPSGSRLCLMHPQFDYSSFA